MALKMRKTKNIASDVLTIFVNSYVNKMLDGGFLSKLAGVSKVTNIALPILVYLFGESILKKIKVINGEYIATNMLEKAIREYSKDSKIKLLHDNAKFIQGDEETLLIEAEEQAEIEAEIEAEEQAEIEGTVSTGDNIEEEIYNAKFELKNN